MEREEARSLSQSDEELIENFINGDEVSFQRLIQRYSSYVISVAFNIMRDLHQANDIAQDVFVKVYKNLPRLKERNKFKSWIYRIVRSTCLDALRKVHIKTSSIDQFPENSSELTINEDNLSYNSSELDELKERILTIITGLPKIYQQIIILKHLREMSYQEMSEFLGIPVATVESRLYRARLMLKDKLSDLYWEGL